MLAAQWCGGPQAEKKKDQENWSHCLQVSPITRNIALSNIQIIFSNGTSSECPRRCYAAAHYQQYSSVCPETYFCWSETAYACSQKPPPAWSYQS